MYVSEILADMAVERGDLRGAELLIMSAIDELDDVETGEHIL